MNQDVMAAPFTIRIFVPDGDPEGVRLIDRMNWTGLGIVFPRSKWTEVRQRPEFNRAGVYILVGFQEEDLPTIYIGQPSRETSGIPTALRESMSLETMHWQQ